MTNTIDPKIIERIRRTLAMSKDTSSPAEAAIATRRVEAMLRQYNLESADAILSDLKSSKESIVTEDAQAKVHRGFTRKVPGWAQSMAITVAELFDVHVVIGFNPQYGAVLRFVGYKTDVPAARYTFSYLLEQVRRFGSKLADESGYLSRANAASYRDGIVRGICANLQKAKYEKDNANKTSSKSTALVVAKRAAIEEQFGEVKYSTKKTKARDADLFFKGYVDGKSVNVKPGTPVGHKPGPTAIEHDN